MRRLLRMPTTFVGLMAVGMSFVFCSLAAETRLWAQANQRDVDTLQTKRAKVTELLKNEHDDFDGMMLDNGDRVHFPPHMGKKVNEVVKVGDRVEIQGHPEVTPDGEKIFEVTEISVGELSVRVTPPLPKPEPKLGPKGKHEETPMTIVVEVVKIKTNPKGDVDGLLGKDGTEVKFPSHYWNELQKFCRIGEEIKVRGRRHVTPTGEIHVHADVITSNGISMELGNPKHGPKPPKHVINASETEKTFNAEILHELREIRRLLSELK